MECNKGVKRLSLISFAYQNSKPRNKFTRIIDVRNKIPNFFLYNDKKRRDKGSFRLVDDFYKNVLALITDSVNDSPIDLEYALGCSRGQYRSVLFVEKLRRDLQKLNITVSVQHRDLVEGHQNYIFYP
jgi:RNase adaptor protein for sRNA GlmZ degradation